MLNYIWLALIAIAVLLGGLRGKIDAVSSAAIDRANFSVTTALTLLAIMTLWLGLMRLADKAGFGPPARSCAETNPALSLS